MRGNSGEDGQIASQIVALYVIAPCGDGASLQRARTGHMIHFALLWHASLPVSHCKLANEAFSHLFLTLLPYTLITRFICYL
jgi:hypothetical protein